MLSSSCWQSPCLTNSFPPVWRSRSRSARRYRSSKRRLLAPILIAIHRFIILDEITKTYAVPLGEPAFRKFFGWLFAFEVLAEFPLDFLGALRGLNATLAASAIWFVAALVLSVGLMVRLSILPPAIAVEAAGARGPQRRWRTPRAGRCGFSRSSSLP